MQALGERIFAIFENLKRVYTMGLINPTHRHLPKRNKRHIEWYLGTHC